MYALQGCLNGISQGRITVENSGLCLHNVCRNDHHLIGRQQWSCKTHKTAYCVLQSPDTQLEKSGKHYFSHHSVCNPFFSPWKNDEGLQSVKLNFRPIYTRAVHCSVACTLYMQQCTLYCRFGHQNRPKISVLCHMLLCCNAGVVKVLLGAIYNKSTPAHQCV